MKKTLLFLFALTAISAQSQNFGIPVKTHPYYGIIEWKGQGGLLLSRSPKEILNQIGMSLVGELEEGKWDQKFNPGIRDPFYLCAENSRFIYFLDNLNPIDNGRMGFNQINMAGNIKSKVLDIGGKVKLLPEDHDYNQFELVDAGVTDKALVYLFRYYNKKEKEYFDFAVFMTHHNLQPIVFQLGKGVDRDFIKDQRKGQWQLAGFNESLVYLSWREMKADIEGSVIQGFNAKGELEEDHFVFDPKGVRKFLNTGYGTTGKYYVQSEDKYTAETGVVSFVNGQFYYTCIMEEGGTNNLVLMERDDDHWVRLNSTPIGAIDPVVDAVRLGASPVKEGIVYHYKHNGVDKVGALFFEKGKEGSQEDYTPNSVYNPSRFLLPHSEEEFVTEVAGKIVVCNTRQFNNSGTGIQFLHR
ncbi:MAG: hypothetical protein A3D92_09850 [Bacteroidetes bacterium RIFCSPHIGHO2_02_FULL_44_7]|nr:MAG: hypothetical protein A3D92_09850 [Bacteroidetes bacterium RIFCSPHIGHO2_02_FULL_44_7]